MLAGGNVADRVVRIGMTVRKPSTAATGSIEAFLEHLHGKGFTGAPRSLGRDDNGRHVLEYIPGATIDHPDLLSRNDLYEIGRLIRDFHEAAQSFQSPPSAQWHVAIRPDAESMICHHDLAPWNLVRTVNRWVFIDWDGSGPGSPLWDLAYAAQSFPPFLHGGDPAVDGVRLRSLVDGYGLDQSQRKQLPRLIADHTRAMYELLKTSAWTGRQPWARLYARGHGSHWKQAAEYVEINLEKWALALARVER